MRDTLKQYFATCDECSLQLACAHVTCSAADACHRHMQMTRMFDQLILACCRSMCLLIKQHQRSTHRSVGNWLWELLHEASTPRVEWSARDVDFHACWVLCLSEAVVLKVGCTESRRAGRPVQCRGCQGLDPSVQISPRQPSRGPSCHSVNAAAVIRSWSCCWSWTYSRHRSTHNFIHYAEINGLNEFVVDLPSVGPSSTRLTEKDSAKADSVTKVMLLSTAAAANQLSCKPVSSHTSIESRLGQLIAQQHSKSVCKNGG